MYKSDTGLVRGHLGGSGGKGAAMLIGILDLGVFVVLSLAVGGAAIGGRRTSWLRFPVRLDTRCLRIPAPRRGRCHC